jgi:hypothetical protein
VQGDVDTPAGFEQAREERTRPQLGDLDQHITGRGRHRFGAGAIAGGGSGVAALIAAGTDLLGGLGINQRLQHRREHHAHHLITVGAAQRRRKLQ